MLGGAAGRVFRDGCSGGSGAAAGLSRLLGSGVTRGDGGAVAQPAGRGLRSAGRGFRCPVPGEGRAALCLQGAAEPGECVRWRVGKRGSDRGLNLRGREGARCLFG